MGKKTPINDLPEHSIILIEKHGEFYIREQEYWQSLSTYWHSVNVTDVEEELGTDYKLISLPVTHLVDEDTGEVFTVEEYNNAFQPGRWKRLLDKDGKLKAETSNIRDFSWMWEEGDKAQQLYSLTQNEWRDIPKPFTDEEIAEAKSERDEDD